MDMEKTGNYIRDKRKLKGWSQEELAERVDVSPKSIGTWESGKGSLKMENAERLADCLGVSIEDLFYGRDLDGIDPKEKAEFDKWIKETSRVTLGLEDRSITTLDIAITAFGISFISAALAMWSAFGKSLFVSIVCLLLGVIGILFIALGRKIITAMNKSFNERKDRISMS